MESHAISDAFLRQLKQADYKTLSTMKFDHASGDLQLIWNTFLDFEAFTREADGDLNHFIEEWKEKMVSVQSAGCQYSELLLGLKLLEKVNLSSNSIMSIISKLGSLHSNSDNFLVQVVTNLKSESGINGYSVDNSTEENNQSGTNEYNHKISIELDIKNNLILCPHCPDKFFAAESLSKHYQELHPNKNQKTVLISKNDLKPDPDLLKYSECDKNLILKEDLEEHQKNDDDGLPLESFVQVWVGSPERCAENPKDDPLMSDEIKMEINSDTGFKYDIKNVQAENESSDHMTSNSSDKFKCDICQRIFTTVSSLRMHMVSHKTSVDFTCYHCGKTHETKHALHNHVKKEHSNEPNYGFKKFPCEICGQQVAHAQRDNHMIKHFRDPIKCEICGKEFQKMSRLSYHMDNHRTTRDFMCLLCGKRFQNRPALNAHKSYHRKKEKNKQGETETEAANEFNLHSGTTNKQFNTLDNIEEIKKDGSDSTPGRSDNNSQIEDKFSFEKEDKQLSEITMKTETEETSGENSCEFSGGNVEMVIDKKETNDQSSREDEGKIPCEICSKLITKHQMINHIKVHRPSVQCQCEMCGEVIEDRKMKRHLKTHLKTNLEKLVHQRNYECSICQKQFKSSCHLKQHIETHNATNEYICSFCGKKYKTKMTLNEHINQHTKGRPLPCQFCDKIFYFYGARTFHIRAHHTGEKPYKCDICDKRFFISSRKVQHMRKHTGEKPFSCDECGKNFREACSLRKHVRTVHKEIESSNI